MDHENEIVISVCLCTYKRADKLAQCLQSLLDQSFTHSFEVIVTDNDSERSGEQVVTRYTDDFQRVGIPLKYQVEPIQNIALARNRSLTSAHGEYIAFIDDDERASHSWLSSLLLALVESNADGAWGPVIPEVPNGFPKWMRESSLFERNNPQDGSEMKNHDLRTSNALIKRALLNLREGPFDESLGKTGGSDNDLLNWIRLNHEHIKFIWAKKAEVYESIEKKRRYIKWHVRRAYRGGWGFSRGMVKRFGASRGFIYSMIRVIPSFVKAFGRAIANITNVKYSGLILLTNISANLGKCGYFLGVKLEEYQG